MHTSPDDNLVSVIIPVFNRETFLGRAIRSALDQRGARHEIIVVDDGSTDATPTVVAGFGSTVTYVRQENRGPVAARNVGLGLAAGNLISFLDADDYWSPDKTSLQLARMSGNRETGIVLGMVQMVHSPHGHPGDPVPFRKPWPAPSLVAALIRRSVFERIGFLDEQQDSCDDVEWLLRANERGIRIETIPDVVAFYRRHEGNRSAAREANLGYFMQALKKSLDRRRERSAGHARELPPLYSPQDDHARENES